MKKTYYIVVISICFLVFLGALYLRDTPTKVCDIEITAEATSNGQGNEVPETVEQEIGAPHDEQYHDVRHRQEVKRLRDSFNPSNTMAKVGKEMERFDQIRRTAWIVGSYPSPRDADFNLRNLRDFRRMMEEVMKNDADSPVMFLFYLLVGGESDEVPTFPRTTRFDILKLRLQALASKPGLTDEDMEAIADLIETNVLLRKLGGLLLQPGEDEYRHELDHVHSIMF